MDNNGVEQSHQTDQNHTVADFVKMSDNIKLIQNLEQRVSDMSMYSYEINSEDVILEELGSGINSEDIDHERKLARLKKANTTDGNLNFRSTQIILGRDLIENTGLWHQGSLDESKLRDACICDAIQLGFIVGEELQMVKSKSHRSVIQNTPDRITCSFKERYGQSDPSCKKSYLQLGVRVPTKEHVSEIVGKQGSKIKQIREKTGALITTPGEQEDHVFIIEASPRTALHVAKVLQSRAEDITMSRSQESRRRRSCPNNSCNRQTLKSLGITGFIQSNSRVILASGQIQVPKMLVGRIIGTQGSIITTIQRDTGTEIRSPPKEIGKPKHSMSDFEILVYQTTNFTDVQEARQCVNYAKRLIAHVAVYQLEKIRAEEAPYSNYRVQSLNKNELQTNCDDGNATGKYLSEDVPSNQEQSLSEESLSFDWLWPDIVKLDDSLAGEVVNRILEESKSKSKTKSEPLIYESSVNNLFTLDEFNSFSNGTINLSRPRHSLPETRVRTINGVGLDLVYRTNPLSIHQYPALDQFTVPGNNSDSLNCQVLSFNNSSEHGPQVSLKKQDLFNFQYCDFNENYNAESQIVNVRRDSEQLSLNSVSQSGNLNINRIFIDQTGTACCRPIQNSDWNNKSSRSNGPNILIKTYADSVKPICDPANTHISTTHGTIGDHLKKTNKYNA